MQNIVIIVSSKNEQYCTAVFFDVAQVFDRVYHTAYTVSFIKLRKFQPDYFLLFYKFYHNNRRFAVYCSCLSFFCNISQNSLRRNNSSFFLQHIYSESTYLKISRVTFNNILISPPPFPNNEIPRCFLNIQIYKQNLYPIQCPIILPEKHRRWVSFRRST